MAGLKAEDALSMAKNFAKRVANGITSVTVNNVDKTITFTLIEDGSQQVLTFDQPADGLSITSVDVVNGKLVCTLSDGSKIESTNLIETVTANEIVADVAIGNVTVGKTYPIGTKFEEIITDMLTQYLVPEIVLTINPTATLYDIVEATVDKITMYASVTKKTSEIAKVEFLVNGAVKNTLVDNVTGGGLFEYIYEPDIAINSDTTFKVVVTDAKDGTSNATKAIKFVGKSYYGIVADTVGTPTEAIVKTLNSELKDTRKYVYSGITTDWGKVCYAYPASFGNLTSIKDTINNLNYTTEFTKSTLMVDGIEYVCYTQTNASAAIDVQLTFA